MSGSDSWAGAPTLAASGTTTIDNTGFTSEASEPIPSSGPGDGPWQSVWWKWVAPSTADVFFFTAGSRHAGGTVGMDTVLAIYTGASLAGLAEVVADDDGPFTGLDGLCSLVTFTPTAGTTYYVQASGFDSTEFGDLHLGWGPVGPSDPPVITAPAAGATYTPSDDLLVTVTWTEAGTETDSEVTTSGAFTSDSGSLGAALTYDVIIPYGTSGTVTIGVRAKQPAGSWSSYTTVDITVSPIVDTPLSCFEDEALADTPEVLWLYRDPSPALTVIDLSGNGRDGVLENALQVEYSSGSDGFQDHHGTSTATVLLETTPSGGGGGASPPAFGTSGYMVVVMLTVYASAVPTLTLPAGWSIVTTEDHITTWATVGFVLTGPATAPYPWSVGLSGATISGYAFALQMFPDWLTVRAGSVQNPVAGTTPVPTPASWPDFQIQVLAYFTAAAGNNYIDHLTSSTEWSGAPHTSFAGLFTHQGINPTNDTPAIAYNLPATTGGSTPCWPVQLILEDAGEVQSPWIGTDTGICDAGCVDVNGSAIFRYPPLSNYAGAITLPSYDPSSLTDWTVEAAGKLSTSGADEASVFVGALIFYLSGGMSRAQEGVSGAGHHLDVAATDCWMHAILQSSTSVLDVAGNKTRLLVNGRFVWGSATHYPLSSTWQVAGGSFGDGVAENCAAVLYPNVLTRRRIAAHYSHFCQICQKAGMGFVLGMTTFN